MIRRLTLAVTLSVTLSACSMPQMAAVGTRAALSPETVSTLASICRHGQPLLGLAALAPSATAHEIAAFVGAYCGQLLAGSVPATTDANTAGWLEQNLGALRGMLSR